MGAGAALAAAGTVMTATGQYEQGQAAIRGAQRNEQMAQYEAAQMRIDANQAMGAAEQNAQYQRTKTQYVESAAIARAAAGGGTSTDPGVVNILANISKEGAYRASAELYAGEEQARKLQDKANATVYGAKLKVVAAKEYSMAKNLQAATTVVKGGSSIYDKYGGGFGSVGQAA